MPSSATSASTITKGTYAYLLQQYGLASAYNSGSLSGTSSVNSNTYNIAQSPLFFVRGGWVDPDNQQLGNAGRIGRYWSSRAYSSTTNAYYLYFDDSNVNPSNYGYRYSGRSLRCLIPTT